jgi:hypothetical protein
MFPEHATDVFITEISGFAHQVISKYGKGDTFIIWKAGQIQPELKCFVDGQK